MSAHHMKIAIAALAFGAAGSAHAQDGKVLTVYTYESFNTEWGPGPLVKDAFEAQCGCTVKFVGAEDGVALLNRLKLEGRTSPADIVLGLDNNLIHEAKETGLFAASGVSTENLAIPGGFDDDIFVPFDYGYFDIVYDSESIETPPTTLDDLVNGPSDEKIVIEDPRTSTPGLGMLLWMKAVYGDEAAAKWETLSKRILTVAPGWSEAYGLFTSGEAPMVLSYTTSPAYHQIAEETDRYKAADIEDGLYVQIEVAGMTEMAEDPALAKSFLEFVLTPGFQDAIPTHNWMMPVAQTSDPLPAAFQNAVMPDKTLQFAPDVVAENRQAWIDEWLNAMSAR
ncbi:thiamine ABC transporter substrate binding subunit [Martelella lutilitoris]|uniref:Thiamine ABC transporter substrate binding subunit n=1 Tax=Martelella lutilitoris TaxID=2583532 RepID=A0A7T7HJH8_9HYPH|nr:thiamine ABC transporter substrate binding subunit [Martelella lutilitoris]QQM30325.1 thiamine ABC transporter substrate binding subunit [Martelella lutilitoris]